MHSQSDCAQACLTPKGWSVLQHWMVAPAWAQTWVCNVDMKYNHAYYAALLNHEIQGCERGIYGQNDKISHKKVSKVMFSVLFSIVLRLCYNVMMEWWLGSVCNIKKNSIKLCCPLWSVWLSILTDSIGPCTGQCSGPNNPYRHYTTDDWLNQVFAVL